MLAFDFTQIQHTEFGFSKKNGDAFVYCSVPVDKAVQAYLAEMAQTSLERIGHSNIPEYQPSEKYKSGECTCMKTENPLATEIVQLLNASALEFCPSFISDIASVYGYFSRMTDKRSRSILGMRRASQFKSIARSSLVGWISDSLQMVGTKTFKLDNDFDVLADENMIYILRAEAFVALSRQKQAVLDAVTQNIDKLKTDAEFVHCENIREYASKHPRAAGYLASICSNHLAKNVGLEYLKSLCKRTKVEYTIDASGDLRVPDSHVLGFLEVLDRRRYELELVPAQPECYVAPSRHRLG